MLKISQNQMGPQPMVDRGGLEGMLGSLLGLQKKKPHTSGGGEGIGGRTSKSTKDIKL